MKPLVIAYDDQMVEHLRRRTKILHWLRTSFMAVSGLIVLLTLIMLMPLRYWIAWVVMGLLGMIGWMLWLRPYRKGDRRVGRLYEAHWKQEAARRKKSSQNHRDSLRHNIR